MSSPTENETDLPNHSSKFLGNVVLTIGGNLISPIVGVVTAPVLAYALGVTDRGNFSLVTTPVFLLTLAMTLGLPQAVTYFIANRRLGERSVLVRCCGLTLAVSAVVVLAICLAAPWLASGDAYLIALIRWTTVLLPPAMLVGVLRGAAGGRALWRLVAWEKVINNGTRLLLMVGFALAGELDLLTAVLIYLGCPVLGGLVYIGLTAEILRTPSSGLPGRTNRVLLGYGLATWIGTVGDIILGRIDQLLLAPLAGSFQLGLYAAAVAIGELPYVISGATADVIMAADANGQDDQRVARASRSTLLLTVLAAAGLALMTPLLVRYAYGVDFLDAVPIVWILLAAAVFASVAATPLAVLLARGRPLMSSSAQLIACGVNVIALVALGPVMGGVGAAWATLIAWALLAVASLIIVRRLYGIGVVAMLIVRRSDLGMMADLIRSRLDRG